RWVGLLAPLQGGRQLLLGERDVRVIGTEVLLEDNGGGSVVNVRKGDAPHLVMARLLLDGRKTAGKLGEGRLLDRLLFGLLVLGLLLRARIFGASDRSRSLGSRRRRGVRGSSSISISGRGWGRGRGALDDRRVRVRGVGFGGLSRR